MGALELDIVKAHVRADDFSEDDAYLVHLMEAAETHVYKAVNRTEEEVKALYGAVPADLRHAMLLLIGHWYNQREGVSNAPMTEAPYTVKALLKPYRRLV